MGRKSFQTILFFFVAVFYVLANPVARHAIPGGMSPTLYLEEAASPANISMGYAGQSETFGQIWINPAYLYNYVTGRTFGFSYIGEPVDLKQSYIFAGFGLSTKYGKFLTGASFMINTFMESYNSYGAFREHYRTTETLFGMAHTWSYQDLFYVGETVKMFYMDYYYTKSFAGSLDLSIFYQPVNEINLSLSFDNFIASKFSFLNGKEALPPVINFGPSFLFLNGDAKVYYMVKFFAPIYESYNEYFDHKFGIEYNLFRNLMLLRLGYDGDHFTMGLGTRYKAYTFSMAYVPKSYENLLTLGFDYSLDKYRPVKMRSGSGEVFSDDELIDFYEGIRKYSEGKYKEAYDDFTKVLEVNPKHELAKKYQERVLLHLKTSDWLDSEQERLINLHKDLAKKYEAQGNYGDAIHEWTKVEEINPADPEASRNIARIRNMVSARVIAAHKKGLDLYGKNEKFKAIEQFTAALALDPEYEPSKEMLIKIKEELSQEELAEREKIENLQKAEVLYSRGLSYYGRKSYEEAILAFTQALELNPDHLDAEQYKKMAEEEWEREKLGLKGIEAANQMYEKGMLNFDEGKFYNAVKDFQTVIKIYPAHEKAPAALRDAQEKLKAQVQPFILEGTAAYRERKFALSKEKFESAIKIDPENEVAKDYLGKIDAEKESIIAVHMQEGKNAMEKASDAKDDKLYSEAIAHFDEVVRLDPENKEAQKYLGQSRNKVKGAVDKLHKAALLAYKAGSYQEAMGIWLQALAIDSANATIKEYIREAEIKQDKGKYDALVKEWNKKAEDLYQNREYDTPLVYAEKTLEVAPNDGKALELKSAILEASKKVKLQDQVSALFIEGVREYKRRNYDEAIAAWEQIKKLDPENTLVDKYIPKALEGKKNRKIIDYLNGMEYYKQGKWLLAQTSFERALKENPSNKDARKMLIDTEDRIEEERINLENTGDEKMKAGKYLDAAAAYSQAMRMKKTDDNERKRENAVKAQEYFERGVKYLKSSDQVGLSIEPFLKVLEINPYDKDARNNIEEAKKKGKSLITDWLKQASASEKSENYLRAKALYTSVLEIEPSNVDALKGQSRALDGLRKQAAKPYKEGKEALAIKNYTLAIDKFGKTVSILASYEDAEKLLAEAKEKRALQRAAAAKSGQSTTISAKDNEIINQGIVLYRQAKYKEAIAVWEKIPKTSAAYSKAQNYIARARLKL